MRPINQPLALFIATIVHAGCAAEPAPASDSADVTQIPAAQDECVVDDDCYLKVAVCGDCGCQAVPATASPQVCNAPSQPCDADACSDLVAVCDAGQCVAEQQPSPAEGPNCDVSGVACEIVPPICPPGTTQTADEDGFCFGACVPYDACRAGSFACFQGGAVCALVPPECAEGETQTIRNGCYGPCVPSEICR